MLDLIFLRKKLEQFLRKNTSKNKVIIINSYDKIGILAKVIKGFLNYFDSDTTILCFKSRIPEEFSDFADRVKISEDYLNHEDYLKIDSYVFNDISKNWDREVKKVFKDIFTYRNIELARIVEYDFQLFLIKKIKALSVINRAIKKEDCDAVFIIDSNRELEHFDRLLWQHYHIPTDFARINEKSSFIELARTKMFSFISDLIDTFAPLLIRKTGHLKLIDARLFYQLGIKNRRDFILAPFERGLRLRLRSLFENGGYIAFDLSPSAQKKTRSYSRNLRNFNVRTLTNQFIFEDISYWEIIEDKINTLIWKDFSRFREHIDILGKVHNVYGVNSVILRNDVKTLEKTTVLSSKKLNISTLVVQHGILAEPNGNNTIFADRIAVWGNRSISWYKKFGNDSSEMTAVGNPNFDRLFDYKKIEKDWDLINKLRLTKKKYLVTLIGSGIGMLRVSSFATDDATKTLIEDVVKTIKSIGDSNLVIKLHPNEKVKTFARLVSQRDRATIAIINKIDLHKLIKASDLIVTAGSTVGLEAIIMKKPLVEINLTKREDALPYVEKGVAIGAYRVEDIEDAIKKALCDEDAKRKMAIVREDFIKDFLYKSDNKAGKRILKLIETF